ncbi:hypothetical protein N0V83_008657 [Neocucurbitaria cava]|uniref:Uncharacterized protein n=1 Tax=Neocucurbitaria cava TaxID=798079 RepID=A0A9W9CI60_9PLEO|nr:hypothetical protein N0V83_008657 [Neocucurbitaria cava]
MLSRSLSFPLPKDVRNSNPCQHDFLRRIYHIAPSFMTADPDVIPDSQMDAMDEGFLDIDWIGIDDIECTDEQLMDDARPGRRKAKGDQDLKLQSIVKDVKRLSMYEEVPRDSTKENAGDKMKR